jgi:hypothetical protein
MKAHLHDDPAKRTETPLTAAPGWRRQQDDLPTRSEAIRRIIDEHLFGRIARPKSTTRKRKPSKST